MVEPTPEIPNLIPLQIVLDPRTRQCQVNGPIMDKGLCFYMLVEAIALIHAHRPQIIPASASDLPPSPILQS